MDILDLALKVGKSKKIKRTGWVREGIISPESVAVHCFRVIVLSMTLAPLLKLNQVKLIKMAIIHDLGETQTGDLVVERGKNIDIEAKKKKEKIEEEIIKHILSDYDKEYKNLFHEMTERESAEAKTFWEIDKLEMAIQAYEYEKEQGKDMSEFIDNAELVIKTSLLKNVLHDINKKRNLR